MLVDREKVTPPNRVMSRRPAKLFLRNSRLGRHSEHEVELCRQFARPPPPFPSNDFRG